MNYLSFEEAKAILTEKLDKEDLGIVESYTVDFQWGTLFSYDLKDAIKIGKPGLVGNSPVLVDKVNGSIHSICYLQIRDQLLEAYREKMGYPHVIKFPVKGDLEKMNDLEKVFALMSTSEFVQIEEAIEIVKEKKLFDLDGLGQICMVHKFDTIVEAIAKYFNSIEGEFVLYESHYKTIPKEIELFKDKITSIWISMSELVELPESILKLKKLSSITVEATPLKKMPLDLRALRKLKEVNLEKTKFTEKDYSKFKLPKACKLIIKS